MAKIICATRTNVRSGEGLSISRPCVNNITRISLHLHIQSQWRVSILSIERRKILSKCLRGAAVPRHTWQNQPHILLVAILPCRNQRFPGYKKMNYSRCIFDSFALEYRTQNPRPEVQNIPIINERQTQKHHTPKRTLTKQTILLSRHECKSDRHIRTRNPQTKKK